MEPANTQPVLSNVVFRILGICAVLLFLLCNPLVLPPRFWSGRVIVWSVTFDTTLLVVGIGLMFLRRWAALLASVLGVIVAINFAIASKGSGFSVPLILILLAPLLIAVPLAAVFWKNLVPGNRRRDPLFIFVALILIALLHCLAFVIRRS
jgi:hypothetical protein